MSEEYLDDIVLKIISIAYFTLPAEILEHFYYTEI